MRYERPAIEHRYSVRALLVASISGGGGDFQPIWRSAPDGDETAPERS